MSHAGNFQCEREISEKERENGERRGLGVERRGSVVRDRILDYSVAWVQYSPCACGLFEVRSFVLLDEEVKYIIKYK